MYSILPSFVLGFHGCDRATGERILAGGAHLEPSRNDYDWLGHGIYFWENSPARAAEYARQIHLNPGRAKIRINEPFALGAIISLGRCMNLLDARFIEILKKGYVTLQDSADNLGFPMARNLPARSGDEGDLLLRNLDCAVVEMTHNLTSQEGQRPFDSVRGVFQEGLPIYPGAGFREKSHIQVCVRNPNCIKGYFRPLEPLGGYPLP